MASSNILKDQILELFPDNNTKEITAADMRIFVNSIFDSKEEFVQKIETADDIKLNNSKIFENSVVIIWNDYINNGVYISKANNPISILQLIKIANLSTTTEDDSDLSNFINQYNKNKNYSDSLYFYDLDGNIIKTELTTQGIRTYNIFYTYTLGDITLLSIEDIIANNAVHINFSYLNGNISQKIYVFV